MTSSSPPPKPGSGCRRIPSSALVAETRTPLLSPEARIQDPLVIVDLDAGGEDVDGAVAVARTSDRLLVGASRRGIVAPALESLVRELAMTLVPVGTDSSNQALVGVSDPSAAEAALDAAVGANPQAATVLARLLRWNGTLAVPDALEAESLAYSTLLGGPEFRRWLDHRGTRPLPSSPMSDPVSVERTGERLRITLNRPERRNAYGRTVRDALVSALEVAEWDPTIRRVVLEGAGPSFCAGGDLDEFGTTPDLVTAHFVRTRSGAALPLFRLADRVEVHLHGACVGAGIELPAYAGRIVAAPDTRIRLPEIGMGLIPGAGGTVSIPRRIGRWRTLYLAVTGEYLDARTALSWGLVDEIR